MGPMLRAVNTIAAAISHDHPAVAVETLAYQQTRGVPKITRPHPNVIVRVCSIVSHTAEVCCDIPTTMLVCDRKPTSGSHSQTRPTPPC